MKRVLCIWLPDWPLQRFTVARPGPDAACGRRPHAPEDMCAQRAEVRDKDSPDQTDRAGLEELAQWCGRFSPILGIEESTTPESLLLDITGLDHLFGSEALLGEMILREFTQCGLGVRMAIADTLGAAWAKAHFHEGGRRQARGGEPGASAPGCRQTTDSAGWKADWGRSKDLIPSLRLPPAAFHQYPGADASGLATAAFPLPSSPFRLPPSVLVIVPVGQLAAALRPLPVTALRLPDDVVDLLHQLGIYQIGQLEVLPRAELSSRFGARLLERWDQATGRLDEPVPVYQPWPELHTECFLEYPTTRRETIESVLEELIGRVAEMLARHGRGAVRLECRLDCQSGGSVDVSVGLFHPSASARHLFPLVLMKLQRVVLPSPVSAVHVEATITALLQRRQEEMFSDVPRRGHPRHLAGLIDRLSSRLGRRWVVRARLVADAQPELAYAYDPLVEGSAGRLRGGRCSRRAAPAELPPRPLRLVCRPIPLVAVSILPDGPPLQFRLRGRQHQVAWTWGPERIETGWWRGGPVGRDYYRVETTAGCRYWVFRRLRDGRWFLHGIFE